MSPATPPWNLLRPQAQQLFVAHEGHYHSCPPAPRIHRETFALHVKMGQLTKEGQASLGV